MHVSYISLNCMWEGVKDRFPRGSWSPSPSPIPRHGTATCLLSTRKRAGANGVSGHGQRPRVVCRNAKWARQPWARLPAKPVGTATCCAVSKRAGTVVVGGSVGSTDMGG